VLNIQSLIRLNTSTNNYVVIIIYMSTPPSLFTFLFALKNLNEIDYLERNLCIYSLVHLLNQIPNTITKFHTCVLPLRALYTRDFPLHTNYICNHQMRSRKFSDCLKLKDRGCKITEVCCTSLAPMFMMTSLRIRVQFLQNYASETPELLQYLRSPHIFHGL
jgi:hypothetical protein